MTAPVVYDVLLMMIKAFHQMTSNMHIRRVARGTDTIADTIFGIGAEAENLEGKDESGGWIPRARRRKSSQNTRSKLSHHVNVIQNHINQILYRETAYSLSNVV